MKIPTYWIFIIIGSFAVIVFIPFFGNLYLDFGTPATEGVIEKKLSREKEVFNHLKYQLLDPNQAPKGIHDTVLYGYLLMTETYKHLPDNVGDKLTCTNCHFAGGNTTGGKNGSISLAGIAAAYPDYNERAKTVVTLPERINGCILRSMNGKPLELNSYEMTAFITYLHWISKDFPIYQPIPWRGLKAISSKSPPNVANGEKIYGEKCALCHGEKGQGGKRIPPLWGAESYNDGAGMDNVDTFAAFIYANMPYDDPSLTEEQAYDVAAYVHEQPRPAFKPKEK